MVCGCVNAQWVPVRRERRRYLIQFANCRVTVRLSVHFTPEDGERLGRTFINQPYQFICILDVCLEIEWLPLAINAALFHPRDLLYPSSAATSLTFTRIIYGEEGDVPAELSAVRL